MADGTIDRCKNRFAAANSLGLVWVDRRTPIGALERGDEGHQVFEPLCVEFGPWRREVADVGREDRTVASSPNERQRNRVFRCRISRDAESQLDAAGSGDERP